jgi:hypothetical protein
MGDEGRSTAEGDDGRGECSTKRAVGGGFPFGGVGVPPAIGRGQEANKGGVRWCSWRACEGGRGGERKKRGEQHH